VGSEDAGEFVFAARKIPRPAGEDAGNFGMTVG